MSIGKFIGCVMMVIGSAIGAGILAMPMVSAAAGFTWAAIAIVFFWVLLTISGLLVAETSSALPVHACSFNSMAAKTLGGFGKAITWISCLFQLYIILFAYISGESSTIATTISSIWDIQVPTWICAAAFTVIMGSALFWGTKTVDHLNRGLMGAKGILLIAALALTIVYIEPNRLFTAYNPILQIKYTLIAAPILLSAFNFHFVIPSIRIYVGNETHLLKWIIITGTTISLVIYLLWLVATLGTIPLDGEHSFATVHNQSLGDFVQVLMTIVNNKIVASSINGFANISMTTSFLGVSLGLFDFLADGFKRPNTKIGRIQTAALTFIPPFSLAILYPNGFVTALSYSSIFIAILCIVLPAMMVYRLRTNSKVKSQCHTPYANNTVLTIVITIGLIFTILPIFTNFGFVI